MASRLEPVPITSQKRDPAWRHCLMYKIGDRVHLKCAYCGKIFKGGGIHRIKGHLAGQTGNAPACLRVQPDVRLLMQESLNGVTGKKRKKQKLTEELSNSIVAANEVDDLTTQCALNTEVALLPVPDTLEPNSIILLDQDEGISNKTGGKKKRGKVRKGFSSATPSGALVNHNAALASRRANDQVCMSIGRFFYDVGVPLDAVNSVYFQPMVDAIASLGAGAVAATPTYHDLRSWVLQNSVQEVRDDIDTGTWGRSGCSVLVDEWMSEKGKLFINFLLYCPEATMFLRSEDASNIVNSADALYELLKDVVEEVGVGNVLQVITNSGEQYVIAGKRLTHTFPTVFWTPCSACCIDLMLDDFTRLDWINMILQQARSISRFIYNHSVVLNMMRSYTFGVDLVDMGVTRTTTDLLTLKRMVSIKHNLQSMVTSEEWMGCSYSKKPEGLSMLDYISSQSFWSTCTLIIRLTDPLLRLLRIVSSENRPAMGYVYAGIYRAKEAIKKEFSNKKDYLVYWNIIDDRWEKLQRHPLHAAGFYLNPKFFYSTEGDIHPNIRSLVYDCVEKLIPDPKVQDKIVKETTSYHNAVGDFGRKLAIRARDTLLPTEWWSTYGGACPNLARLAIRILSQACSLIRCKPDGINFEQIHESKNILERQRLRDLVFVQYNFRLRQMDRKSKEQDPVDPLSHDNISMVEDWVTEKQLCIDDCGSSDWTTVDPPLGNTMFLGLPTDDAEALGAGFDDCEIFEGVKDSEDENDEKGV